MSISFGTVGLPQLTDAEPIRFDRSVFVFFRMHDSKGRRASHQVYIFGLVLPLHSNVSYRKRMVSSVLRSYSSEHGRKHGRGMRK